jgi:outer membrane lipoprotein-sorting protein
MKLIATFTVAICATLSAPFVSAAQTPSQPAPPANTGAPPPSSPSPTKMDAQAAINGVNAWFNHALTMQCDFVQLGPNGHQSQGELYVQRPGRLRFEYAPPSSLEIIADGHTVAVRDRKLGTQDKYFISQTPLKFLLKEPFDLARDTKIRDLQLNPDNIAIRVEDSTTFGGTSRIRLIFDPKTFALEQWAVIDPQGYETLVSLYNMKLNTKPNPQLFVIPPAQPD